jgi:hypothetical protein
MIAKKNCIKINNTNFFLLYNDDDNEKKTKFGKINSFLN